MSIQLALQQAEARARVGDTDGTSQALDHARTLLANHQAPDNPRNHFALDHSKFDLREMRILLVAGHDDQAERIAIELQHQLENPDGTSSHPMRSSEVLASRALVEARRRNISQAVDLANQAMDIGRRSRLSFRQITSAVTDELSKHERLEVVQRFLQRRAELLNSTPES